MDFSRSKVEQIVIGTLMNEYGGDGFFDSCRMVLRKELFADRRNAFIFDIVKKMHDEGITETTPHDVFRYATDKNIRYGDMEKFCSYMCEVSDANYAFDGFGKYVRILVDEYLKERKHGRQGK